MLNQASIPTRPDTHRDSRALKFALLILCPGWESNPHPFRDTILSRARIPVPPPGHWVTGGIARNSRYSCGVRFSRAKHTVFCSWRPRGESNSRIEILQISELPLFYVACLFIIVTMCQSSVDFSHLSL